MIRLYYFQPCNNFGDHLSPVLCQALSGQRVLHETQWPRCDLLAIGSILHLVRRNEFRGAIWGSGLIQPPKKAMHFPHATVYALRGKLTRDLLGYPRDMVLGDPGLLADRFAQPLPKRYKLGVIAHFMDKDHPAVKAVAASSPHVVEIDICGGVQHVIDQVSQCEAIVSSAMHGLILADSLGIPNGWIRLSNDVMGGDFKFRDYYSVFGIEEVEPIPFGEDDTVETVLDRLKGYERPGIEQIKRRLEQAFPFPLPDNPLARATRLWGPGRRRDLATAVQGPPE